LNIYGLKSFLIHRRRTAKKDIHQIGELIVLKNHSLADFV